MVAYSSDIKTPMNVDKKKTGKKREVTLRFDLELIQPSDEATNEFSYVQLVKDEEKKVLLLFHDLA